MADATHPPQKRTRWTLWAVLGAIGTIGAAIIALNTFTGLNLRPAWAFEIEALTVEQKQATDLLEKAVQQQNTQSRAIVDLKKGQLELRVEQIEDDQRELRRELSKQRQLSTEYEQRAEPIPGWLSDNISDTESDILKLEGEKGVARDRILELTE